jgi:hypothetical protein
MTDLPVWAEYVSKLGVSSIALLGAVYTARQYQRAKRWRAGDLAATLIAQLETDEELAFACRALDWGVGPLVVPKRYWSLLERVPEKKNPTPAERGEIMQQDCDLMARAVRVGLAVNPDTEPGGLVYRYCFDKLFAHLANVHRLLLSDQITLQDLDGLKYWLQRIAVFEYPPAGTAENQVFQPFLEHAPYGYRGVIDLGERLGVPGWLKTWTQGCS